eukprot:gene25349-biopygen13512
MRTAPGARKVGPDETDELREPITTGMWMENEVQNLINIATKPSNAEFGFRCRRGGGTVCRTVSLQGIRLWGSQLWETSQVAAQCARRVTRARSASPTGPAGAAGPAGPAQSAGEGVSN